MRRNEDTAGSPGDKAKTQETGADGKKKRGPPVGHEGKSHNHTTEMILRYELDSTECSWGGAILLQKPISNIITDFDTSWNVRSACAIIHRGKCDRCGNVFMADSPFRGNITGAKNACINTKPV